MAAELTHADVERIIELAQDGQFTFLRLESDGVELRLERDSHAASGGPPGSAGVIGAPSAPSAPSAIGAPGGDGAPARPPVAAPVPTPAPVPAAAGPDAGRAEVGAGTVVSPMIGIVYLAPRPDAEPYVRVGQRVEAGATVGLVEVMKMFTAVQADLAGTVCEIFVESGQQVDRGQPLVRVEA